MRLRSANKKPYEIIDTGSDEHSDSDKPPVSFHYTLFHPYEFDYMQSKRAKADLRTLTLPPVESEGNGAPKVVRGSAVESGHVPPWSEHSTKKEYIWDTVSNHMDYFATLLSSSRHSYDELISNSIIFR